MPGGQIDALGMTESFGEPRHGRQRTSIPGRYAPRTDEAADLVLDLDTERPVAVELEADK